MNNGEKTAEFGDELIKEYDGKNGYEIYHDHGSKDAKNGHVCAVKLVKARMHRSISRLKIPC